MKVHHNIIRNAAVTALLFAVVLFFLAARTPLQHAAHVTDHDRHHVAPAIADTAGELQAHSDMEAFAAVCFIDFTEVPDSFGGTSTWHPDFDLHWMQVEHDGHLAMLYHLSGKHDDATRLVNVWDSHSHAWTGWTLIP